MNTLPPTTRRTIEARRSAFTLIELLVVIGIIVLLTAITIAVGPSVLDARKSSTSEQIITGLDGILETYIQERGGAVPPDPSAAFLELWQAIPPALGNPNESDLERMRAFYGDQSNFENVDTDIVPVTNTEEEFIRPSSMMFLFQAKGVSGVDAAIGNIPSSRLVQVFAEDADNNPVSLTGVLDAWGNATRPYERHILYVHPSNERAQQLYGYCQNGRPYFLSAGADGVYGSIHDLTSSLRQQARLSEGPFQSDEDKKRFFEKARADNVTSYEVRPSPIAPGADLQLNPEQ